MPYKIFFTILITAILASCGGTTKSLSSGTTDNSVNYKVNSYYGCCGCDARYILIDSADRKLEQLVYSYDCPRNGMPTKFIFNYDAKGKLTSCTKLVATTSDTFNIPLSFRERNLILKISADTNIVSEFSGTKLASIKGFRKPAENEITHLFPLIKKGSKLKVL